MPDHSVHQAADLAPDERALVERWLGRALFGDETITLHAYRLHPAPSGDERDRVWREIATLSHDIGSRANGVDEEEVDALIDEAFAAIRSNRS